MRSFSVDVPDLAPALTDLVRQVPRGHVTTYGDLAEALGDSRAAIWVATFLANGSPHLSKVSHRVVNVRGEPARHAADSLARLTAEGVPLNNGRVDLEVSRFRDFQTVRPLDALKRYQERLAKRVRLAPLDEMPTTVAAVDCSYGQNGVAVGAYVLMQAGAVEPVWTHTVKLPAAFPYIQGFLSYRELPIYARLLRDVVEAGRVAPVLLVDGNGILHPRRAGIASQLGVLADHPTVGIGKSLLCGKVHMDDAFGSGTGRVVEHGETIAAALPPSAREEADLRLARSPLDAR